MKFAEIEAIFTKKVTEYIVNGYSINVSTMGGHQGEIAKVDLRKGTEIIRVFLETRYGDFFTSIALVVGRNTDERIANSKGNQFGDTIWNERLEIIEEVIFWQMQKRKRGTDYYLEGEAGEQAMNKSWSRARSNFVDEHPPRTFEGVEKIVAKAVRRHLNRPGFKSQNVCKVWKSWSESENRYIYKVQTLKHTIVLG